MFTSTPATTRPNQRLAGMYSDIGAQATANTDASGHALIGMLYEGALGSIARARGALRDGDVAAKSQAIRKAVAIVGEGLRSSLNLKQGGQLAADLDALYGFVELRLTHANLHNDDAALDECARVLRPLYEGWQQIAAQVRVPT